jgi:putative hydrolase of the HAD superfamily
MEFHFKKAMIYDLDNTLYDVQTIGDRLFAPVLELISNEGNHEQEIDGIREDLMRIPFQQVAQKYQFNPELRKKGEDMLQDITYEGEIPKHEDYPAILELPGKRYLVTTGFYNMQQSKVRQMELEKDFAGIHIVDPMKSDKTKEDIFLQIMQEGNYDTKDIMVIGDDPESEIKAGRSLGIETVLYDKKDNYHTHPADHKIRDFRELVTILIN